MSDILSTSVSGLLAFQRALDVTSNNIANAATPGYSVENVNFTERPGQATPRGYIGSGVDDPERHALLRRAARRPGALLAEQLLELQHVRDPGGADRQHVERPEARASPPACRASSTPCRRSPTRPPRPPSARSLLSQAQALAQQMQNYNSQLTTYSRRHRAAASARNVTQINTPDRRHREAQSADRCGPGLAPARRPTSYGPARPA